MYHINNPVINAPEKKELGLMVFVTKWKNIHLHSNNNDSDDVLLLLRQLHSYCGISRWMYTAVSQKKTSPFLLGHPEP